MKTIVDIYPEKQNYSVAAEYILVNKNKIPVTQIFITERMILSEIHIENAELILKDTVFGTYLFQLKTPLNHSKLSG